MKQYKKMTRREFVAAAGGTVVRIGLPGVFVKIMDSENLALASELRPDGRSRIPPGQHAVKALVPMGGVVKSVNISNWRLLVHGEVKKPTPFTFADLMSLPQIKLTCDVHCVTGWSLLDSKWRGIQMKTIMDLVKIKDTAGFVIFEGPAGYSSNIPIIEARKDNVILAHSYQSKKLPQPHGAPLRALVPDRYFYKSVKWINGIKFSAVDEPGYYERNGWSNTADPWKEERYERH